MYCLYLWRVLPESLMLHMICLNLDLDWSRLHESVARDFEKDGAGKLTKQYPRPDLPNWIRLTQNNTTFIIFNPGWFVNANRNTKKCYVALKSWNISFDKIKKDALKHSFSLSLINMFLESRAMTVHNLKWKLWLSKGHFFKSIFLVHVTVCVGGLIQGST